MTDPESDRVVAAQLRLVPAGVIVGVLAGLSSAAFLTALRWVTDRRIAWPWTIWLLPLAGLAIGIVNLRWGGRANRGNRLVMAEIESYDEGVPAKMAPLVLWGTLMTHAFGGSAGREGTALQMSASLTDGLARRVGLSHEDRRTLLIAALSAAFGAVFGVPWAGVVFGLEVAPATWQRRLRAVPACVVAAFIGDRLVGALGVTHTQYVAIHAPSAHDLAAVALAAPAFGLCAWLFLHLTSLISREWRRRVTRSPLHPMLGGVIVVALTLALGTRDYNGLSLPLITRSFSLVEVGLWVWAIKLVMTAITVGSGFAGGEVTPLFVMGATLGAGIGNAVGGPVTLLAAVGLVATFGAAAHAPIACFVMGLELFGPSAALPLAVGCVIARVCTSKRSLYDHEHEPVSGAR